MRALLLHVVNSSVDAGQFFFHSKARSVTTKSDGIRGQSVSNLVTTEVSTLGDLLLRASALYPQRPALIMPARSATYADVCQGAQRFARALLAHGVKPGEHVALLMPNCIEYVEALFGIVLLGCVAVPLNIRLKPAELGYIISDSKAVGIFTSRHTDDPVDFPSVLNDAQLQVTSGCLRLRLLARGATQVPFVSSESFLRRASEIAAADVEEARRRVRVRQPALIIYTSGTTANPKGCVLSHEAVTRGPVERARYRLKADAVDITWGGGPLFHIGTLAPLVGSVGVAGTFLTDSYFDAARALTLMYDHGVTLAWPWFPAILRSLIDHPLFSPKRLSNLKHLFLIGPPVLVDEVQRLFPESEAIQACGMTETAGVFALCSRDEDRDSRSSTQGKPSPGVEVRIVDPETGRECANGALGEIWVRGYNVMDGYWGAPDLTQQALTPDGWLKTGDLYTRLENGSLIFGGRYKDMLKVGGENVSAVEVEAFLCTHPAVKTAEVVGRPDPRLDEVPVAFIELREGQAANETGLIEHCRGRIASYKVPRAIVFIPPGGWPMSATKIDKRALRALVAGTAS
jgi:acyl-CoA synthetase (AMP-forming)/AMP-acid ligase II